MKEGTQAQTDLLRADPTAYCHRGSDRYIGHPHDPEARRDGIDRAQGFLGDLLRRC